SCVDPRIKQRSRLHWWLAEQEVHRVDPEAHALLQNADGHVTETAAANVLLVRDGVLLTPPRHTVLEGVCLPVVGELCPEWALPLIEQPLTAFDCINADEAMLTSTPYCLAPVARINGTSLRWPGPTFERLLGRWSESLELDIRQQIFAAG